MAWPKEKSVAHQDVFRASRSVSFFVSTWKSCVYYRFWFFFLLYTRTGRSSQSRDCCLSCPNKSRHVSLNFNGFLTIGFLFLSVFKIGSNYKGIEQQLSGDAGQDDGGAGTSPPTDEGGSRERRRAHRKATRHESRYHSEVRQEAVQQVLAAMQNRPKPSMPMPSKRTSTVMGPDQQQQQMVMIQQQVQQQQQQQQHVQQTRGSLDGSSSGSSSEDDVEDEVDDDDDEEDDCHPPPSQQQQQQHSVAASGAAPAVSVGTPERTHR